MNIPVLCDLSNEECCTLCYLAYHLEQVEQERLIRDVTKLINDLSSDDRKDAVEQAEAGCVIVSTYGLLISEEEAVTAKPWNVICLDEAHSIKNASTKTSAVCMRLHQTKRDLADSLLEGTDIFFNSLSRFPLVYLEMSGKIIIFAASITKMGKMIAPRAPTIKQCIRYY